MIRTMIKLLPCLFLGVLLSQPAIAQDLTGDQILKKVEDTLTGPEDRDATLKMTLVDKDGNEKLRELKIFQKGDETRLIRFLSPADVKGVGFLVLSDDVMYLYMPAFHKIRRIASHVKNENFMGTDFTYDDMAQSNYTEDYTAKILEESEDIYSLELTPKPDSEIEYSKLRMWVNRKTFLPDKVEFYDEKGKLLKKMTNSATEQIDGYWTPRHIEMEDVQKNHKTLMELKEVKHNVGLKDKLFSKRYLKRG
ncbi:MAG: outer membrane lipoprotein-sorting protein [Candidatus Latescibacteria bacterium]|nr:outer membrane lipoprotein-sorting protein [Candidatus Latescibacterota bacterium]